MLRKQLAILRLSVLIFIIALHILQANVQDAWLKPPYEVNQQSILGDVLYLEAVICDTTSHQLLSKRRKSDSLPVQLKIFDENPYVVHKVIVGGNNDDFSQIFADDFDNDGLSEIYYTLFNESTSEFHQYNGDKDVNRILWKHILPNTNARIHSIFTNPIQYDSDEDVELIIAPNLIYPYPGKKMTRGIYCIDVVDNYINWFYPTAHAVRNMLVCSRHDSAAPIILYSSAGVNNGMAFSNGAFFNTNQSETVPDTVIYTVNDSQFDKNAADFSNDDQCAVVALDLEGNRLWQHQMGGALTWGWIEFVVSSGNQFCAALAVNRGKENPQKGSLRILNPVNGGMLHEKHYSDVQPICMETFMGNLVVGFSDGRVQILNSRLDIENETVLNFHIDRFQHPVSINNQMVLPACSIDGNIYLFNEVLQLQAIVHNTDTIHQLSISKRFITKNSMKGVLSFVSFHKLMIWKRIHPTILLSIIFSFAGALFIVLIFWLMTYKKAHRVISDQKAQLENQQKQLALSLNTIIEQEKLSTLGVMAASFAHEMNSPLGAIFNSIQRLKVSSPDNENVDLITRATQRCRDIVDSTLNTVRSKHDESFCNPAVILKEWKILYGRHLKNLGIDLINELPLETAIQIPQADMNQIFNNLLNNASDALSELNQNEKWIEISGKTEGKQLIIEISDNANGIPEQIMEQLYEPFQTTKESGKGTGMGLYIVNQIIQNNNSSINVTTGKEGTTWEISLPIA